MKIKQKIFDKLSQQERQQAKLGIDRAFRRYSKQKGYSVTEVVLMALVQIPLCLLELLFCV